MPTRTPPPTVRGASSSRRAPRPPALSKYPHLTRDAGISNGAPTIRGTRTTVRTVAEVHQMVGMSADDIVMALPYLREAEVHAALAYYFDHQPEIDAEIEAENDFGALRELSGGRLLRFEPGAPPAAEP